MKVFVATDPDGDDAESCAVLEYTLKKNSPEASVTFIRVDESWNTKYWTTPFSGLRWAVPTLCGFKGRAIYMDSDMIVQSPLDELWNMDMSDGAFMIARKDGKKIKTCVTLFDCEKAEDLMPPLNKIKRMPNPTPTCHSIIRHRIDVLDPKWNCTHFASMAEAAEAKILHYTRMDQQPQVARAKARGVDHWYDGPLSKHDVPGFEEYFVRLVGEAEEAGFTIDKYIPAKRTKYKKRNLDLDRLKSVR